MRATVEGSGANPTDARVLAALRRQHAIRRAVLAEGATHVGWKIGGAIPEIDALTAGAPLTGYLTSATALPDGASCDATGARELRAETEVLIQVTRDVAMGQDSVAVVGVAIELVDVARPPDTMEEIVAANVFHHAAILGSARVGALARGAQARLWVDGRLRETAPATTDVAATIKRVVAVLAGVGERVRAGDLILAGSLTHVPVRGGSKILAEIDGVGRVQATVAGAAANP